MNKWAVPGHPHAWPPVPVGPDRSVVAGVAGAQHEPFTVLPASLQKNVDRRRPSQVAPPALGLRSAGQDHHGVVGGGILHRELEDLPRHHATDAERDRPSAR